MYKLAINPFEYVAVSEESMPDNAGQHFSNFMKEQQIFVSTILYFLNPVTFIV